MARPQLLLHYRQPDHYPFLSLHGGMTEIYFRQNLDRLRGTRPRGKHWAQCGLGWAGARLKQDFYK